MSSFGLGLLHHSGFYQDDRGVYLAVYGNRITRQLRQSLRLLCVACRKMSTGVHTYVDTLFPKELDQR